MSFWSFKACTFGGFLNSKKWILIWGFFIPPGKYEHSVSILRRWREDGSQDKDQMARLVESVVMTVLTTLMTEMTMTIYSGVWLWALNEELLPQWQELPARGSQHFLAPLLSQKKVLKHLHPLFLVLCLQMPRKRSSNAFFFCEPSCYQVSFAIYVHMYTSALNSFLHHRTCSKWTALLIAAHRKQTNKLLRLLWLSHRRKAQVQRTENISRYLKTY